MVCAQNRAFKDERRIYLWDVTLSMKGQGSQPTPDIYSKVVEAMEKDINSIKDEQTEILVLPFQTGILERWCVKATAQGKKEIINRIKTYKNNELTKTNIAVPMQNVMDEYIRSDKRNVLILLTDGLQNANGYPMSTLLDLIRKWCSFAEEKDAYAFYVMLTSFAVNEELNRTIDESCRISRIVSGGGIDINFVELLLQDNYKYNIKDDAGKKLRLKVDCKKQVTIPEGMKIHCVSESNPYVEVAQSSSVSNGFIEIALTQKMPYDSLKHTLPQDANEKIALQFYIENEGKYPLVKLLNEECTLELINKPEKTLKVYVKD